MNKVTEEDLRLSVREVLSMKKQVKNLTLSEALNSFDTKCFIRRESWAKGDRLVPMSHAEEVYIYKDTHTGIGFWNPTAADLYSNDWMLIDVD